MRKIDTLEADYTNATVASLPGSVGKGIATDDKGRVYIADGSDAPTTTTTPPPPAPAP